MMEKPIYSSDKENITGNGTNQNRAAPDRIQRKLGTPSVKFLLKKHNLDAIMSAVGRMMPHQDMTP